MIPQMCEGLGYDEEGIRGLRDLSYSRTVPEEVGTWKTASKLLSRYLSVLRLVLQRNRHMIPKAIFEAIKTREPV